MKSTIRLAIIFLATLTCTTYTVKQNRNACKEKRYRLSLQDYVDRNKIVPQCVLRELDRDVEKEVRKYNYVLILQQHPNLLMSLTK